MRESFDELSKEIIQRKSHVLILHGNVYDNITFYRDEYNDVIDCIINIESSNIVFPWCVTYDIFSGATIVRGNSTDMYSIMGISMSKKKGTDADLIRTLKEVRGEADGQLPKEPEKIFPMFDALLNKSSVPMLLIIDYAENLIALSNGGNNNLAKIFITAFTKWARNVEIKNRGHMIVLITRDVTVIDESILDRNFGITQIRISKPNEEERKEVFDKKEINFSLQLAKATSGLSIKDIKNVLPHINNDSLESSLDVAIAVKKKILKDEYSGILEVITPRFGFDGIGGLENLIDEFKFIAKSMREGNGTLVPQGILMMGPPGTGKTVLAEATAKDAGVTFVRPLDLKSMWVGESEKRASKFYNALRDMLPVVVFIDEIDQYQKQRNGFDGDSGTSASMFKKMLEFMSDSNMRGKVLFIFATNRPDLLDPALKRDGRCDLRVALLPPTKDQLALICKASFKQYPEMKAEIENWEPFVGRCEGYNGANMVEIVRRAWTRANKIDKKAITPEEMEWALKDYIPQRADNKEIAEMALISIENCSSQSLLPSNYKELEKQYSKYFVKKTLER